MTSFWLTRESLCPLWPSCLIWYPWSLSSCLAFVAVPPCGSLFTLFIAFSASFRHPFLLSPWDSQNHHQLLFFHGTFYSLVFYYYSQAEHFHLPVLSISISSGELNWQFGIFKVISCHLKLRKITGNSLIRTCHSSSSAHCCWQLYHSPSGLKLGVSLTFPCKFLCTEIIMAGSLQGLWELGKSFWYSHKCLSKAQHSIFLLPLTSKILTPHFLSKIHALATSVTFFFLLFFWTMLFKYLPFLMSTSLILLYQSSPSGLLRVMSSSLMDQLFNHCSAMDWTFHISF